MKIDIYVAEKSILFQHFRTKTSLNVDQPKMMQESIGYSIDRGFIHRHKWENRIDSQGNPYQFDLTQEKIVARFLKDNPDFVIPTVIDTVSLEELGEEPTMEEMEQIPDLKQEEE